VVADEAAHGEPVQPRHVDVEHDERDRCLLKQLPGALPVLGEHHFVPEVGEDGAEEGAGNDVVVGEEDAHGAEAHRTVPARTDRVGEDASDPAGCHATAMRRPRTAASG
jgi:hypothetical protein